MKKYNLHLLNVFSKRMSKRCCNNHSIDFFYTFARTLEGKVTKCFKTTVLKMVEIKTFFETPRGTVMWKSGRVV
jgi:hypothetical protein